MDQHTQGGIADAVRETAPVIFAGMIIVAGMWMVYDLIVRGLASPDAGLALLSGIIGAAVASIFQRGAIQATARAVTNGAAMAAVQRAREAQDQDQGTNG